MLQKIAHMHLLIKIVRTCQTQNENAEKRNKRTQFIKKFGLRNIKPEQL